MGTITHRVRRKCSFAATYLRFMKCEKPDARLSSLCQLSLLNSNPPPQPHMSCFLILHLKKEVNFMEDTKNSHANSSLSKCLCITDRKTKRSVLTTYKKFHTYCYSQHENESFQLETYIHLTMIAWVDYNPSPFGFEARQLYPRLFRKSWPRCGWNWKWDQSSF